MLSIKSLVLISNHQSHLVNVFFLKRGEWFPFFFPLFSPLILSLLFSFFALLFPFLFLLSSLFTASFSQVFDALPLSWQSLLNGGKSDNTLPKILLFFLFLLLFVLHLRSPSTLPPFDWRITFIVLATQVAARLSASETIKSYNSPLSLPLSLSYSSTFNSISSLLIFFLHLSHCSRLPPPLVNYFGKVSISSALFLFPSPNASKVVKDSENDSLLRFDLVVRWLL